MTALPPPTYYFNGITFNSAFYPQTATTTSSSGNGITEAQANLLYLRKTTTDTASALETFSAGIATSSIDTASTGGILNIGGTNATGGINIGKSAYITTIKGDLSVDGTISSLKLQDSGTIDLKTAGVNLNIGTTYTANVNIGKNQGNVKLKGNTQTDSLDSIGATLSIGGSYASTAVNIGNGSANTNITNLRSASLDTPTGTTTLSIGGTNATVGINLGSTTIPTSVKGALSSAGTLTASGNLLLNGTALTNYIQFPDGTKQYTAGGGGGGGTSVNFPTPQGALTALEVSGTLTTSTIDTAASGTLTIGGTNATTSQAYAGALTTGTINIASSQTTGAINIGTASGRISTGGGTNGQINIGTGSSNSFGINIGGSSSTTSINGTLSGLTIKTSSIDTPTTAYALEIGKTNATTSQSYAGALTTNDLTIASSQTTGVINIGTGSGRINTGGATKGAINIGTGAGANAFGINIGGSGTTTTIGGDLAVTGTYSPASITTSGMITANGGLTLGNSNNLALGNGTVAPTTPSQLFGNYSITFTGTTLPATGTSIGTVSIAQAGTYWVMWHYEIASTTSPPFPFYSTLTRSSTTNNTLNTGVTYGFVTGTSVSPQRNANFGQQVFTQTNNTSTSYGLIITYAGGTANTQNSTGSFYRIFRIA